MNRSTGTQARSRLRLIGSASLAAIAMASTTAYAQDADAPAEDSAEQENDRIIVTGSRLRTDGMSATVPITVVAADEIETLSPGALITGISQLPQFYGNQTPNSGNFFSRSGYGTLNLRGLGVNRTLTLLNGRRVPSTSAFGGVDINLFPEAMIASVETTTGGASAAYGSDAVAGVVNFTLDTDFTGLELSAQAGVTDRNDGRNYELSAAWGADFADGKGHILVSGEYYNQDGIFDYSQRDWYNAWGTLGSGTEADPYVFAPNTISRSTSLDGTIFAPGTSLNGLIFDRNGGTSAFIDGDIVQGGPLGIPPARHSVTNGGSGTDNGAEVASLSPDLNRYSFFTYADYEFTPNFKVFAQYLHGKTNTWQYNTPRGGFGGTPTTLTIFADNAFLPDDLAQTMANDGIDSFVLRRMGSIEDVGTMYLDDSTTQHIGVGGFEWDLDTNGFMDGWRVDGFYQFGKSKRDWRQQGLRADRIFAAIDAVDEGLYNGGAANGNIICRVTAAGASEFPGCQPLNLFGRGNATAAAVDYVTGFEAGETITTPLFYADTGYDLGETYTYVTSPEKRNLTTFKQHFAELSFAGDLMEGPAGPIALAFGGSYRKDSIKQLVQDVTNPASDHENGHPVLCNGEALGLRGVSGPDCGNTVGNQYSKVSNIQGQSTVLEAFAETLIPLIDTDGFGVNANAAVRWSDYSGSGTIWAYKGGLNMNFGDSVRLRGTYSRDVRAGNLSERFDKTGGSATIDDPRTADVVEADQVTRFSGGNPAVRPEQADTFTAGLVFQPTFIDGLSMSLDWYQISISDAISQVGVQQVLNRCFLENAAEFCDLISLDPATDAITLVGDVFVNVAESKVSGIDFEASYNTGINVFGGDESLGFRGFASWLLERSETNSTGTKTDFAGQTGATQGSGAYLPYADFKATASLTYRNAGFSGLIQARYTGAGVHDVTKTEGIDILDNTVDSALYLDLRLGHTWDLGWTELEVFGNITNLLDESPPITPSYSAFLGYSTQQNTSLFDVMGRRYTFGVKLKM